MFSRLLVAKTCKNSWFLTFFIAKMSQNTRFQDFWLQKCLKTRGFYRVSSQKPSKTRVFEHFTAKLLLCPQVPDRSSWNTATRACWWEDIEKEHQQVWIFWSSGTWLPFEYATIFQPFSNGDDGWGHCCIAMHLVLKAHNFTSAGLAKVMTLNNKSAPRWSTFNMTVCFRPNASYAPFVVTGQNKCVQRASHCTAQTLNVKLNTCQHIELQMCELQVLKA